MGKNIAITLLAIVATMSVPTPAGYHTQVPGINPVEQIVSRASAAEGDGPLSVRKVWVTAYSSSPDETDETPFETASMTEVRDGIIAANFLPFGTKVLIPELFGDKIFVVEDRMHQRKKNFVDVWMPSKNDAIEFGITNTEIVILSEV